MPLNRVCMYVYICIYVCIYNIVRLIGVRTGFGKYMMILYLDP